jgi:hypothetical protein
MKTFVSLLSLYFLLMFSASAQNTYLNVSGHVTDDSTGMPVPNHSLMASTMGGGFFQTYTMITDDQGFYQVFIQVFGSGTITVETEDCNGFPLSYQENYDPDNMTFVFDFSICTNGNPPPPCSNSIVYEPLSSFEFSFTGTSYPVPANSYYWDFGDGQTGYGEIVSHSYQPVPNASYLVTLYTFIWNPALGDSCMATSSVQVVTGGQSGDCINWFEYTENGNYSFNFTGHIDPIATTQYLWDFGDGTTGSGQEITHIFQPGGMAYFTVCLTTYSFNNNYYDTCFAYSCQQVYVGGQGGDCQNSFSYETWNNIDFAFMGESVPPANFYYWDFGDGTYGTGQNATHTYGPNIGEYVVVGLTTWALDPATGDSCTAFSSQEVYLGGTGSGCENWFWYELNPNAGITFHGESYPYEAQSYFWDFGDGQFGNGQEVVHLYDATQGNVFLVMLTTLSYIPDGDSCIAVSQQEVWLSNQSGCENWFWYENTFDTHFVFHGESYPYPASEYIWDFGDGNTGFGQVTEHNYDPNAGEVFMVTLTTILSDPALGDSCVATSTQEVWVNGQSGDCVNWFWFESLSTFEYLFHGESEPPATLYVWTFENGMVEYGQEITHSFDPSSGDIHSVCLTTYHNGVNGLDSCTYTSCQEIILGGPSGAQIWGNIFTGDSPSDFALVGLFGMTPDGGFTYDFTVTLGGMYFFENVLPGNYYIFASLTPQSQNFFDYFPTYYSDAMFWSDAILINLGEPQNPYDIHLVPIGETVSGPGSISGTVTAGGTKAGPISNITVVLMDQDENPLAYTQSNEEGAFAFANIALNTYKLKVEIPGKPCEIASVSLTDENQTGNVTFIVKDTEVVLSMKNSQEFVSFAGDIFPNPVTDQTRLSLSLIRPADLTIKIMNQLGQEIQSSRASMISGPQVITIETASFESGFYTLQILDGNGGMLVKKFIK